MVLVLLSALACADEPAKARIELYGDYGSMYAGTTRVDVELMSYYHEEVRTLKPFVSINFEPLEDCSHGDSCSTKSASTSYYDVDALLAALRNAQTHLAAGTAYAPPPKAPASPCGPEAPGIDYISVDAATHRMRFALSEVTAEFDADEVDWLIKMLEPAGAMLKQLRPQVDGFNALAPSPERPRPTPKPCGATPAHS
jgi:hypothetical protein